ncbi:hypothetical protein SEA_IDYN_88 [Gordonia phage IDyn]|uniref:Uncharacterized protein n=1 Tax=Gordonia phage IDyn TaxID=2510506 RepID=A0A411CUB3_9CAUD|nr:hypothetical protein KNU47_gp88 [Gordonia phage IDyn]QAY17436.1 hypothetical protein SEA_IDYN_88 [Gordonia phage IDyn]
MTHTLTPGTVATVVDSRELRDHVVRVVSVDVDNEIAHVEIDRPTVAPGLLTVAVRFADLVPATGSTKITKLTAANVRALREAVQHGFLSGVETGETVATFVGTPADALARLDAARDGLASLFGTRGHPVASIPAVRRKLIAAAAQ